MSNPDTAIVPVGEQHGEPHPNELVPPVADSVESLASPRELAHGHPPVMKKGYRS